LLTIPRPIVKSIPLNKNQQCNGPSINNQQIKPRKIIKKSKIKKKKKEKNNLAIFLHLLRLLRL